MISVIIPLYNAENTIEKTMNSILNQVWDLNDFEIIIVNDASTDNSTQIVEDYIQNYPDLNITLLHHPENKGVSATRNTGLQIAKGQYIALLDADDEWLPEKTQQQMAVLQNTDIDLLGSRRNNFTMKWPYRVGRNGLVKVTFHKLLIRNELPTPTVIFKRKILAESGLFNTPQRYAEDIDFWMRVSLKHKIYILNESLVITGNGKRSFGVSGLSANIKAMHKGSLLNLKTMRNLNEIRALDYFIYRIFYKLKYYLLVVRTFLDK